MNTPDDGWHPVSGNREFGIDSQAAGDLLYTRGADRIHHEPPLWYDGEDVFEGGHDFWLGWQRGVVEFIRANGGWATAGEPISERFPWEMVREESFRPTVPWHENEAPQEDGWYASWMTPLYSEGFDMEADAASRNFDMEADAASRNFDMEADAAGSGGFDMEADAAVGPVGGDAGPWADDGDVAPPDDAETTNDGADGIDGGGPANG
jgi:hypothetical protein